MSTATPDKKKSPVKADKAEKAEKVIANKNPEKSKKNPHDFSLNELMIGTAILISLKEGEINVDYDKLAANAGFANPNSARANVHGTLRKLKGFMTPAAQSGDNDAAPAGDASPTKKNPASTPKRKAAGTAAGSARKRAKKVQEPKEEEEIKAEIQEDEGKKDAPVKAESSTEDGAAEDEEI